MGKRQTWTQRFNRRACEAWRCMQTHLAEGDIDAARNYLGTIHMELGISAAGKLPVRELHRAAFPNRAQRPDLMEPPKMQPEHFPEPDKKTRPRVFSDEQQKDRPRSFSDEQLIEKYREVQQDLSRRIPLTAKVDAMCEFEEQLMRSLDICVLDRSLLDAMTDEIHSRAYADGRPRIILDAWLTDDSWLE